MVEPAGLYFTALSIRAQSTCSSRSGIGDHQVGRSILLEDEVVLARSQGVPGAADERGHAEDLLARGQGADLQPRDGEELPDHPSQAVRLLGDRLKVGAGGLVDPLRLL